MPASLSNLAHIFATAVVAMQISLKLFIWKFLKYQIIYRAVKKIQQKTETNPLSVLRQAIRGVTPDIAVKARRIHSLNNGYPIFRGSFPEPIRISAGLTVTADGTKLLFKEDLLPSRGDIRLFSVGPSITVISILLSYLVIWVIFELYPLKY
uniref:Small ribosomal subunit protein uS7 domain-containing protein n=1 Tax=Ananas comosus var. bracteatus TaxID=296719 RepID=A0A6V7NX85_ANACO|nr:unnamed protein product [Ananas comosus var. bracteatus]